MAIAATLGSKGIHLEGQTPCQFLGSVSVTGIVNTTSIEQSVTAAIEGLRVGDRVLATIQDGDPALVLVKAKVTAAGVLSLFFTNVDALGSATATVVVIAFRS